MLFQVRGTLVLIGFAAAAGWACDSPPSRQPLPPVSSDSALSVFVEDAGRCSWRLQDPVRHLDKEIATFERGCDGVGATWTFGGRNALVWLGAMANDPVDPEGGRGPRLLADTELWMVNLADGSRRSVPIPDRDDPLLAFDDRDELLAVYYEYGGSPGSYARVAAWLAGAQPERASDQVLVYRFTRGNWRSGGRFDSDRDRTKYFNIVHTLSPRSGDLSFYGVSAEPYSVPFEVDGSSAPLPGGWTRFVSRSAPERSVVTRAGPGWGYEVGYFPPTYLVQDQHGVMVLGAGTNVAVAVRGAFALLTTTTSGVTEFRLHRFLEEEPLAVYGTAAIVTFWPVTDSAVLTRH